MPRVTTELNAQYWEPESIGPVAQLDLTAAIAVPATIAAGAEFSTGLLYADGYKVIAVGATLAAAGTITIKRYIDAAGMVPQGQWLNATLQAGAPGAVNATDGIPFQSFVVTIANTSSSDAALTAFGLLLNAA